MAFASGDFTAPNVIQSLVAAGAFAAALVGAVALKTSNKIARVGIREAEAAEALIRVSQEQVAAASRQAELAREALAATTEPLVILPAERLEASRYLDAGDGMTISNLLTSALPTFAHDPTNPHESIWVNVPVRNVGPGPAVLCPLPSDAMLLMPTGERIFGRPQAKVLASGDVTDVTFCYPVNPDIRALLVDPPVGTEQRTIEFNLLYTDIIGRRVKLLRVRLRRGDQRYLTVVNVDVETRTGSGEDSTTTTDS